MLIAKEKNDECLSKQSNITVCCAQRESTQRQPNEVAACAQTDLTNMFRDCAFDGNKFVNLSLRKLRFLPPWLSLLDQRSCWTPPKVCHLGRQNNFAGNQSLSLSRAGLISSSPSTSLCRERSGNKLFNSMTNSLLGLLQWKPQCLRKGKSCADVLQLWGQKKWQKLTNMRKLQPEYKAMYAENNSITTAPSTDADWHFPLNLHLEGPTTEAAHKNKHFFSPVSTRVPESSACVCWRGLTIYHVENFRNICDTPGESRNRISPTNRVVLREESVVRNRLRYKTSS